MRQLFYVNRQMCGGEELPAEFDLDDFCEVLQGKLANVEVVPVDELGEPVVNRDPALVPDSVFFEALGEYMHR
ncbi:MAG TPA: hypothetical protein PLX89_05820 [Verrucomicrobiota bacterium]|nr:hypothetical protein [Verrucomicrobiota bacterium]